MNTEDLLDIALKAGELLLCSGAEIYRVEDTILRIFNAYGVEGDCFVLLTGIFISAKGQEGTTISRIKRIKGYSFNLHRIELVNAFSRDIEIKNMSFNEAMKVLRNIEAAKRYSFKVRLLSASLTAFVYALLFRGSFFDATAAFFIGMVVYFIKERLSSLGFFQFFEFLVSGLIAGGLSIAIVKLFPDLNIYKIIIGSIMILVPGMAITTGIKDALYGDIVSSLYRLAEAIFISTAVGAGVGIMLSLGLRLI